jgi:hypothetical protein
MPRWTNRISARDTPFDQTHNYHDVTTVLVSSEFSRTLRQRDRPIDATGTDHNPYCNSLLVAGKEIREACCWECPT